MKKLSHLNSVLHVEDELLISMETDDALREAGVTKVLHSATVSGALSLISSEHVDAAIVDLQLRDGDSDIVVNKLQQAGIPFIIVSGRAPRRFDENFAAHRLDKPASNSQLTEALNRLTASRAVVA